MNAIPSANIYYFHAYAGLTGQRHNVLDLSVRPSDRPSVHLFVRLYVVPILIFDDLCVLVTHGLIPYSFYRSSLRSE